MKKFIGKRLNQEFNYFFISLSYYLFSYGYFGYKKINKSFSNEFWKAYNI